ncbi:hypothetical protein [Nocardioides conyzicola]|uniref:Class I SAM-dependent methyltransferase n=1 Tax=Nocardioides conyzicola TaxID=1651781 RepID=A0ABP8WUV0_9ACTN
MQVDDTGIRLPRGFSGSADVLFDGRRVWSFSVDRASSDPASVVWPKRMKRLLDGQVEVRVVAGDREIFVGERQFGTSAERLRLVDAQGTPIVVDKWGLIQRPFEDRDPGVIDAMADKAVEILRVMRDDCGVEGWIAFGSLLGAARNGRAIGHDSDIDLCFLSTASTPAAMAADLWRIGRALRRAGMRVTHASAAFITVRFRGPDGGAAGIDIYITFYLDGLLYETATVRAPVPLEALLPLRDIEFEGRMLPAPADPAALLEVSYGPNWRVPDPSFQHQPGPEIVRRFDSWFGSLMRGRRDWRHANATAATAKGAPSEFAGWVCDQITPETTVVEIGAGGGADLRRYAEGGRPTLGLDYAVPAPLARAVRKLPGAKVDELNLYDRRDVLVRGARLARRPGPRVIAAYRLLETLEPDGIEAFWLLTGMALRSGGRAYVGGVTRDRAAGRKWAQRHGTGRVHPFSPASVEEQVLAAGGRIVERSGFDRAERALRGGPAGAWRMIVEWPERGSAGAGEVAE